MKPLRSLMIFMAMMGGFAGGVAHFGQSVAVLAYATNVSHGGLLASTNQQRSANGLGTLGIDSLLNSAAQAKANDMVAKDYWSHTSPDGRQPWDFILAAGYSYNKAGENLAYGALTSEQTVQAWMDSPGHRANILKPEFSQVGFGFANSANYQGSGPQTVIVAMYATPYGAPAPPPPPPPAPAPAPKPAPTPATPVAASSPAPEPPVEPAAPAEEVEEKPEEDEQVREDDEQVAAAAQIDKDGNASVAPAKQAQTVRNISLVTGIYSSWLMALVIVVGVAASVILLYQHSKSVHSLIIKGENFIINHPVVDAAAIMTIVTVVVLLQSAGQVL